MTRAGPRPARSSDTGSGEDFGDVTRVPPLSLERVVEVPYELEEGITHVFLHTPAECQYVFPLSTRIVGHHQDVMLIHLHSSCDSFYRTQDWCDSLLHALILNEGHGPFRVTGSEAA